MRGRMVSGVRGERGAARGRDGKWQIRNGAGRLDARADGGGFASRAQGRPEEREK